jgi:hypothetical protein
MHNREIAIEGLSDQAAASDDQLQVAAVQGALETSCQPQKKSCLKAKANVCLKKGEARANRHLYKISGDPPPS